MKRLADTSIRSRIIYFLIKSLGVIFSLVLLVVVIYFVSTKNSTTTETTRFAVAKTDITGQQVLTKDMVGFQEFDTKYTPINGLTEEEASQIIGKKVFIGVQRGDLLSPSMFGSTKGDLSGGIANLIPKDKKLVYIKLDDVHIFPPDIQKENTIDIIGINQKELSNNTDIVAEKIKVFDVIHSHENGSDLISEVGLLLSDTEVLRLSSKFTPDWKLNLSVHPQHEGVSSDTSLTETASSESKLKPTPTENEKKITQ